MAAARTVGYFSHSNPAGRGQGDVAALLRRGAGTLGDVREPRRR